MSPDDGLWLAVPFLAVLLAGWLLSMAGITEQDNANDHDR